MMMMMMMKMMNEYREGDQKICLYAGLSTLMKLLVISCRSKVSVGQCWWWRWWLWAQRKAWATLEMFMFMRSFDKSNAQVHHYDVAGVVSHL
jgi:hypothetical protein